MGDFDSELDLEDAFLMKREAEEAAAAELQELEDSLVMEEAASEADWQDGIAELIRGSAKSPMESVIQSGLAYTIVKVKGVNDHPGGKYPIGVIQESIHDMPLSASHHELRQISTGDVAELAVSALMEPACVNVEIAAGEKRRQDAPGPAEELGMETSFEISSTMQEDVKAYLKRLT